jgi:hypothetical protein
MFQQRVKHLRHHELEELVDMKKENEYKLKVQEDQHRLSEMEARRDERIIKAEYRTQEADVEEYIRKGEICIGMWRSIFVREKFVLGCGAIYS